MFKTLAVDLLSLRFNKLREQHENGCIATNTYDNIAEEYLKLLDVKSHCKTNGEPLAYTVPWLTQDECTELINLIPREYYEVNEQEPEKARIPESVLQHTNPKMHKKLGEMFFNDIEPIIQALTGFQINNIVSVQLAVYEAKGGVSEGTWHTDTDSDISVTVALNDNFSGGGLDIVSGGIYSEVVSLPQQAAGTATIFKGRTSVHAGLPVTEGTRHLLVFWTRI